MNTDVSAMQWWLACDAGTGVIHVPPAETSPASTAAALPAASRGQHGDRPKQQSRALPAQHSIAVASAIFALLVRVLCSLDRLRTFSALLSCKFADPSSAFASQHMVLYSLPCKQKASWPSILPSVQYDSEALILPAKSICKCKRAHWSQC